LPHGRIAFNVLAKAPNGRQTVPDTAVRCSFNISLDDLAFTGLVDNALCQLRDILRTNPFGEWEHYVYCPRPSADSVSILSRRVEKPPRASKKRPTPPPSAHPPPTPPTLPTPPTPPTPPPPPEPALPHTDKSASARALVERLHALARSAAQHGAKTEAAEAVAAARAMLARGDTEEAKAAGEWLGAALRKQMTVLCAKVDTKVVKK
jgi:type IV secretory pathway VirB10-like protein